jgi:hypothetical protein
LLDDWEARNDKPNEDDTWRQWRESVEARILQLTRPGFEVVPVKPSQSEGVSELAKVVSDRDGLEVVPVKPPQSEGILIQDNQEMKANNKKIAIKRAKELRDAGKKLREIAAILDKEGIPTSRGIRGWATSSVDKLLKSTEISAEKLTVKGRWRS